MTKFISIGVLAAALFAGTVQAQDNSNRVSVNWSDPSRPGLVKVTLLSGSITVKTHAGADVIVQSSAVSRRGRTPEVTPDGLRRIDTNGQGLAVQEANNVLTVSSGSFT